ncbi:hypothetical protein F941_00930 [Acinetobacter bouvetii DSM 14964 = CIP 107468]|uniref:Uncharacterized protein n=1 Tax=Acinetobacter bouvetii DSM 14964 = CIP 107468 TaxID=1120925 RepID=N9DT38_9GAMM|nr:hypothetical protein F941_00930 [Acinetobacter bouvetii DSM 14964 = CIP 107468]
MLILRKLKNEEIRNHFFNNLIPHYFVGHTMDVSWFSGKKLKPYSY